VRRWVAAVAVVGLLLTLGCSGTPQSTGPPMTQDQARVLASQVASSVVANDPPTLYGLMEPEYRASTSFKDARPLIVRIVNWGGRPTRAVFKQEESGTRATQSGTSPVFTYWYLLQTSGGSKGPWYLKVDVVSSRGNAALGQFSVVNFPVNGPPDSFK